MSKTLFIAGAAVIALATPALAQQFGTPLEAPRESSPKFGTGPVISPEVGHPPAFGGEPVKKQPAKKVQPTFKGGVIEAPALSSATQHQEPPVPGRS